MLLHKFPLQVFRKCFQQVQDYRQGLPKVTHSVSSRYQFGGLVWPEMSLHVLYMKMFAILR